MSDPFYNDLEKRGSFYHDSEGLPAESLLGDQLATSITGPRPSRRALFHEVKPPSAEDDFSGCQKHHEECNCRIKSNSSGTFNHRSVQLLSKGLPQQAEVAQGVPGRLRPRIFFTFGTTRVRGRQSYAPASFTAGEIRGTHF
jgi:hypothetical protein